MMLGGENKKELSLSFYNLLQHKISDKYIIELPDI